MTLYDLLFLFFREKVFYGPDETLLEVYEVMNIDGYGSLHLGDWLSHTASIISITIIVVLCCLFVYKIIKLIGGLIR